MVLFFAALGMASAVEIAHEDFVLENGLEVILIEDHTLPQVVVNVWYGVGSYDDPQGASGFAHLFEHLMFKGTEKVPAFDPLMEAHGGANNATTGNDRTNYYSWGASNILELLLYLEADRMTGLQITQEKLDVEREVVRNELRQNYENRPYGGVWLSLSEMLYPKTHPYHWEGIGSHEHLLNANLRHVQDFYSDWYAPNNARLAVAGDFDPLKTRDLIVALFGDLQPSIVPAHTHPPEVKKPQIRRKILEDAVSAPALVMAWHSPALLADGDADLDVLSSILSGHDAARLDERLVHGGEGAQEISVWQQSSQRGSVFFVWILAEPGADLAALETAVHQELALLQKEKLATKEEMAIALNNTEMLFLSGMESLMARAEALQSYAFYAGADYGPNDDLERYRKVSSESLKGTIQTWLTPEAVTCIEVHPKTVQETVPTEEKGGEQ